MNFFKRCLKDDINCIVLTKLFQNCFCLLKPLEKTPSKIPFRASLLMLNTFCLLGCFPVLSTYQFPRIKNCSLHIKPFCLLYKIEVYTT